MFTVKILKSYFLDGMVYMYVALWMLNSQYGIKFSLITVAPMGMIMMMIMMKVMMMVNDDSNLQ